MNKTLYPRNDVDSRYVQKKIKKGGIGLASIEENIDASIRLEDYIKKRAVGNYLQPRDNTKINGTKITRKQKMECKATVWTFQATHKRNLTRENMNMAIKGKPWEKN